MALNKTSLYISNLYSYKPAYNNLYKIQIFDPNGSLGDDVVEINNHLLLHATQVSFNGESLVLTRNSVTKQFTLPAKGEGYKLTDELRITWRESDAWQVKKFHEEWLRKFYIKETDTYVSGPEGKAKQFLVTLPFTSNSVDKKLQILFSGVYPKDTGNIDLRWSAAGGIITHTLSYYVTHWEWYTSTDTTEGIVLNLSNVANADSDAAASGLGESNTV